MPSARTTQGQETFDLWRIFFFAAIVVAAIVYGLIVWSVIRYRRRRSDEETTTGAQFSENLALELVYTAVPVVIVVALFALSVRTEREVTAVAARPDVIVNVEAYSWGWRFSYEDRGVEVVSRPSGEGISGPQLVLPLGETTRIVLTSNDVIHAFWVPDFLFKRDAIPGRRTEFDVTPNEPGVYHGACAEFCGLNHAYMVFSVRVVSASEFDAWLNAQRAAQAQEATTAVGAEATP
jgi:cytochrome c oxidase subunit 2